MLSFVIIAVIIFLSIQVFPISLGISKHRNVFSSAFAVFIISGIQILMYWIGLKVGDTIMYLVAGFSGVVVFIGFLLTGIRMLMEVFTIRRGERSFLISDFTHISLASVAQGINSFLVGLMFYFVEFDFYFTISLLGISSLIFSVIGLAFKPNKTTLALASLLYTIGGLVMLFSAVYFSFFYL